MKVKIRKFTKKDIPNKIQWINNSANNQYLHYDLPLEYKKTCVWYEGIKNRVDRYDAVIEADGIPVGLIGLLSIDRKNGKAEYYITMGESSYKGRGIAKKASRLLLSYGFEELGLNRIYLYTEIENMLAQRMFESIGFILEGTLREDVKKMGKYIDRFVYGMLKQNWGGLPE